MTGQRLHAMDALRAIAMFLGVILHALMSYQVYPRAEWPQDPTHNFIIYDWLYHWIHAFRMPLFFLVAGFFARFLYYKIGGKPFFKHRFKRIVIPFTVSLFVILPLSTFPFQYYGLIQEGLTGTEAIQASLEKSFQWNGLIHLWFLYYLIMMYLLMVLFIKIGSWISISSIKTFSFSYLPINLLLVSMILTGIIFMFYNLRVEPWHGASIKLGQLLYYGLFFLLGYMMQRDINTLNSGTRYMWVYLAIAFLLQVVLHFLEIYQVFNEFILMQKLLHNMLYAMQTVFLTFGMLAFFIKLFQKEHKFIRYFSDASYWIYLIHFPIVVGLQIGFMNSWVPNVLRLWLVLIITTILVFVTYHLFIRFTFIGSILHGPREKERFPINFVRA